MQRPEPLPPPLSIKIEPVDVLPHREPVVIKLQRCRYAHLHRQATAVLDCEVGPYDWSEQGPFQPGKRATGTTEPNAGSRPV